MKPRPRLLDLFCGAGGCAAGYARAGFDVIGVDIEPQPSYPFAWFQQDALEALRNIGRDFDAIHASPPCQAYSRATAWRGRRGDHPDLIAATRELLVKVGKPYVIENVQEARHLLRGGLMLCGTSFGLPLRRHRWFEMSFPYSELVPPCQHRRGDYSHDHGGKQTEATYRAAMGCDWMTVGESRQAVPPAFCEWIGRQLLHALANAPVWCGEYESREEGLRDA
jgi:site-specific DNA-cytosine methylase